MNENYILKNVIHYSEKFNQSRHENRVMALNMFHGAFSTILNANYDSDEIVKEMKKLDTMLKDTLDWIYRETI